MTQRTNNKHNNTIWHRFCIFWTTIYVG